MKQYKFYDLMDDLPKEVQMAVRKQESRLALRLQNVGACVKPLRLTK